MDGKTKVGQLAVEEEHAVAEVEHFDDELDVVRVGEVEEAGDVGVLDHAGRAAAAIELIAPGCRNAEAAADEAEVSSRTAGAAPAAASGTGEGPVVERTQRGDVVARQARTAGVVVDAKVHQGVAQSRVGLAGVLARMPEAEGVPELVPEKLLGRLARVGRTLEKAADALVENDVSALDTNEGLVVEAAGGTGIEPRPSDRERAAGGTVEVA